jgi:hypothetical protein
MNNQQFNLNSARLLFWLSVALCYQAAWAQTYTIDWFTADGGGGTSRGGVYSLTGTIGQPDASTLSGGQFTLQGGFWPGIVVPSQGQTPTLFIQLSGGNVSISWSPPVAGFVLEQTDGLEEQSWLAAPSGNPVSIPAAGSARFYRLRKP